MRYVVIGLGVTGDAVVRFARERGDAVTVIEDRPSGDATYADRKAATVAAGAEVVEAPTPDELADLVAAADVLVPSPGVPARHPAITAARDAGVPVRAEVDLAAAQLGDTPLVAVTGTNGKTTVTMLITRMLAASGVDAIAAGNIGLPLLDAVTQGTDVVVAEVSSFQLAFTTPVFRPRVAVLLNLAEDHLDWHETFAQYAAAKAKVFANQLPDDALVFNADDEDVADLVAGASSRLVPFPGSGALHEANELAAGAAAREVGATDAGIDAAVRRFEGMPHRVQLLGERGGVRYYDDSKATNPHATLAAVNEASGPVVLIAGGRNKGLDLGVLRALAPRLRAVVAIGEAAPEVTDAFRDLTTVVEAGDMRTAVVRAAELAQSGDVVLLSPACASFDWYDSYGARGDDFAKEVASLNEGRVTA